MHTPTPLFHSPCSFVISFSLVSSSLIMTQDDGFMELKTISNPLGSVGSHSLVAKILSDKIYTINAIRTVLGNALKLGDRISFKHPGDNSFMCAFNDLKDKNRIIEKKPWTMKGAHVVLKEWESSKILGEIDFSASKFWVQAHHNPPNKMSIESARRMERHISGFLCGNRKI